MAKLLGTDLGFSRADIDGLAQELDDKVGADLTPPQRALLLAIFTAAGDHVSVHNSANAPAGEPPSPPELAPDSLHALILKNFIPELSNPSNTANDYCIQMRISPVGVKSP
jgi:hypothetical protein